MILDGEGAETTPWEESYGKGGYEDDETGDDTYLGCDERVYKDCFCRQLHEHVFVRKLEDFSRVRFDWLTFYKELLYHTIFPASLPLMALWEGGTKGILNRQFWGSRMSAVQWFLSICFFMLNCLTPFYTSPDIVIADILWIMRNMILATKYGFISKGEMEDMRHHVLPMQVHLDRTLVLAWTNPIPMRVVKHELLLAAARKDQIRCTSALRLCPGASNKSVCSIMQQFLSKTEKELSSYTPTEGSGWGSSLDEEFGFNQTFRHCPDCIRHGCTKDRFEDRWINLSITKICTDPGMRVPKNGLVSDLDESGQSSQRSDLDDQTRDKPCPALDLPALLLAAFVIQRASDLLKKKNFLHQIFSSPWRVYYTSAAVGVVHGIIPFATRAIAGSPSTFGGKNWYHIVVSLSCFSISYSAMSASVMFMLAGCADFRRRYLTSRLLNTMLKDGWFGEDEKLPKYREKVRQQRLLEQKSVYHLGFTIDFTDPRSMAGWWAVRVLVQDFGMVFYMRVKQYASYFAFYCALLMGFLIVELFANGARTAIYILHMLGQHLKAAGLSGAVVVFDLVAFLCLLCLMVFPGGEANDMNNEHGATLVRKKMAISNQLHCHDIHMSPHKRSVLQVALELLQSVSQAVYWDNTINKVTILGFTAGGELIAVLIGFGSAAIGIAAQQLTSKIS